MLPADLALLIRVVLNHQGLVVGWARRCGATELLDPISRVSWPIAMTRSAAPAMSGGKCPATFPRRPAR